MRKICLLMLMLVAVTRVTAQELVVKDFHLDPFGIIPGDDRVYFPSADHPNRKSCPLIKVTITHKLSLQKGEGSRVQKVVNKDYESWIYVLPGTKVFDVVAEGYNPIEIRLEDYPNITSLEENRVYILELGVKQVDFVWGVRAGMNLSSAGVKDSGAYLSGGSTSMKGGFHAGVSLDVMFTPMFGVATGLFVTTKGHKFEADTYYGQSNYEEEVSATYLEIPIQATLHFGEGNVQPFVSAGPYVAFGLSGKFKNNNGEDDDKFFDREGASKLDFGLGASAGLIFSKHVVLSANFETALGDYKSRNLFFTIGYNF